MSPKWKWLLTGVAIPLVAAIIAGGIVVLTTGKARIEVVADSNTYSINPAIVSVYEKVRNLESSEKVLSRLKASLSSTTNRALPDDYLLSQASRDLAQSFTEGWDPYEYSLLGSGSPTYYYIFRITNLGSKIATNPTLQVSQDGYFRLSSPEITPEQGNFSSSIKLPNLKPGVKHLVQIWTNYQIPTYADNACTVNYDEGVVRAQFPIKAYGRLAAFFETPIWWLPTVSTSLLVIWISFLIGRYYQRPAAPSEQPRQPPPAPIKRKRKAKGRP